MHPVTPVAAHWLTTVQIGITVSSGADDAAEMGGMGKVRR